MSTDSDKKTDLEKAVELIDTLFCDLNIEDIDEIYYQMFPESDPYREIQELSLKIRSEKQRKCKKTPEHLKKIINETQKSHYNQDKEKFKLVKYLKDKICHPGNEKLDFSYSFRNKSKLTENDMKYIQELEDELLDDLKDDVE